MTQDYYIADADIPIDVNRQCIDNGEPQHVCTCAVALALRDSAPFIENLLKERGFDVGEIADVEVDSTVAELRFETGYAALYFKDEISSFIEHFDDFEQGEDRSILEPQMFRQNEIYLKVDSG